jgi:hypothetical protein
MWSFDFLKQMGYVQLPDEAIVFRNNMHTDLHYEAIMAVADPELVELGKKLAEHRAEITVRAIRDAVTP